SWIHVYTDGSATSAVKNGGAGVFITYPGNHRHTKWIPTGKFCSNYTAEIDILEKEVLPDDWTEGTIVKIPQKRDLTDCNNWRGITLLSVPSKMFSKIIIMRLEKGVYTCLRVEQAEFRRQGCVMSSLLFNLVIDWILKNTVDKTLKGIRWTQFTMLEDLDCADDIALLSDKHEHVQEKSNRLNSITEMVGLRINTKKTKIMTNSPNQQPVTISNQSLENVEHFTYLGTVVSLLGGREEDIQSRLNKARAAFGNMRQIWKSNSYCRGTKRRLYKSIFLPVLLYGAECWRMTKKDAQKLSTFHHTCLRRIIKIFWPNTISNTKLLQATNQETLDSMITKRRWKWLGHVKRMTSDIPAKTALTWTPEGKRKQGRPKTTWRRTMESDLSAASLTWKTALKIAQDRKAWKVLSEASCAIRHNEN
ncbi:unnamed protein product, partial [Candidula unifasciata]